MQVEHVIIGKTTVTETLEVYGSCNDSGVVDLEVSSELLLLNIGCCLKACCGN